MTGKQYGYIVQALAEAGKVHKVNGDDLNQRKVIITLQAAINIKQLNHFFDHFDEEQLVIMAQALEETADRRQIWATTIDAERMRETAALVRSVKNQRELKWIEQRFQEGIA